MLLDLRKLKRSGKDTTDFYFEYHPTDNLTESLPDCELVMPIKVNGSITLTGEHSAYVQGTVDFRINGECTRCLENATNDYNTEFAESVTEDNDGGYVLVNDTVNLQKIVDDVVMMNVPLSFLCKEDCLGLCPQCGTNLNDGECQCKKQ